MDAWTLYSSSGLNEWEDEKVLFAILWLYYITLAFIRAMHPSANSHHRGTGTRFPFIQILR